jgi:recombination protein RecA
MAAIALKSQKFGTGLVGRGLEGLQHRRDRELQPSGIAELDALLGGGFPRGSLVELCGPASSGRTSLAFSLLAQATDRQEACAFVDVCDSLDPMSLAAAGVELPRVLWVRCGETESKGINATSSCYSGPADPVVEKTRGPDSTGRMPMQVHGWRHPRESMRGVDKAIPRLVGKQAVAAESPRIHVVARCAEEQVERDRELPRRGFRAPRALPPVHEIYANSAKGPYVGRTKPWKRLEQALKTTDLLLHSGGWGVVVFDLGGISWVDARRINLSMWFRFKRAVENTSTILLLVGEESCAKSCASVVLRCGRKGEHWTRAATQMETGASTFEGFEVQGEFTRSRVQSQPADFARWQTHTP